MGWFSDLRDGVLKPALGFAVGGPAGAAVVSGYQAMKDKKKKNETSYSAGLQKTSVSDVSVVNNPVTPQAVETQSRSVGLGGIFNQQTLMIGLLFGFVTLFLTAGRR